MPDLREKFGIRLRELRLAKQLTQENLAELTKLSVDFLSLVERGRSSPSFENIDAIASALHVEVAELFKFGSGHERG